MRLPAGGLAAGLTFGSPLSLLERATTALQDLTSDLEQTMATNAEPELGALPPDEGDGLAPPSLADACGAAGGDERAGRAPGGGAPRAGAAPAPARRSPVANARARGDEGVDRAEGAAQAAAALAAAEARAEEQRARADGLEASNIKLRTLLHKLNEAKKQLELERASAVDGARLAAAEAAASQAIADAARHRDALSAAEAQLEAFAKELAAAEEARRAASARATALEVEARARNDDPRAQLDDALRRSAEFESGDLALRARTAALEEGGSSMLRAELDEATSRAAQLETANAALCAKLDLMEKEMARNASECAAMQASEAASASDARRCVASRWRATRGAPRAARAWRARLRASPDTRSGARAGLAFTARVRAAARSHPPRIAQVPAPR